MNRAASIALLFACLQVQAQSLSTVPPSAALSEAPAGTNTLLVIRAGDLGDQTVVLEINGSKAAELKSSESYSGVYSPGRLRFTFAGTPTHTIDAYAIANEEHVYELTLVAVKGAIFSGTNATRPVLTLKERKTLIAGYVVPPAPAKEQKSKVVAVSDLLSAQKQVIAARADAGAWRELGRHYLAAGDAAKATRAYREALRLQPEDADARKALEAITSR